MRAPKILALSLLALMLVAGCGSDEPNQPFTGSWSGTASFASGFSAGMNLTQSRTNVTGTMRLAGGFIDRPLSGTVVGNTMQWLVFDGCEKWLGTATLSDDGTRLTGPIQQDLSGCPSGSGASGTINLTRQ